MPGIDLTQAACAKAVLLDKNDPEVLTNTKIPNKEIRDQIIRLLGKMMDKDPAKRKSVKDAVKFFNGLQREFIDVAEHTRKIAIIDINEFSDPRTKALCFTNPAQYFDEIIFVGSKVQDPNDPETLDDRALSEIRKTFEDEGVTVHDHVTFPTHDGVTKKEVVEQVVNENKQKNPDGLNTYFYLSLSQVPISQEVHQIPALSPREVREKKYSYEDKITEIAQQEHSGKDVHMAVKAKLENEIQRLNNQYKDPDKRKKYDVDKRINVIQIAIDKFDHAAKAKTLTHHYLKRGLDKMQDGLIKIKRHNRKVWMTSHHKTADIIKKAREIPTYSRPKLK